MGNDAADHLALQGGVLTHVWYWVKRLPERKGHPCRVLARGGMNSCLVEFADGYRVVTSRNAVRRAKEEHCEGISAEP